MIVLDIEASGSDFLRNGIWQIGALDLDNPKNCFLDECRIDDDELCTQEALSVIDKTEKYLRDPKNQSEKELLEKFFRWCDKSISKNFLCQGPQFDVGALKAKASKYGLKYPFHWRAFDLHSIAGLRYHQLNGEFLMKKSRKDMHSDMSLTNILKFCGMKDNRAAHNALEDCKLTAECFFRIVYGKNLLKEFNGYPIPEYLKINL